MGRITLTPPIETGCPGVINIGGGKLIINKDMFFRLTYIIKSLGVDNDRLEFDLTQNDRIIHIELQKIPNEELKKNYEAGDLRCIATVERKVSDKSQDLFRSMTTEVPNGLKPLIDEVGKELSDGSRQVITNIRWKWGLSSLHNFVRVNESLKWSLDRTEWRAIPCQTSLNPSLGFPIMQIASPDELTNLQDLLTSNTIAPLGHELFSEAWTQRMSNPRSSLVIGVAAAETAFKECVGRLIPEAKWLIQNTPSPPLVTMLKEFLPTLPVKATVRGKTLPPPENILATLRKGIKIRNEIVHGANTSIRQDTLESVLKAIRDLLYLLDMYSGFNWAEDNISIETKNDLINDSK